MVKWTGAGRIADLRRSVRRTLAAHGAVGSVEEGSSWLLVRGRDPVRFAHVLQNQPGVEWIAVGVSASSAGGLKEAAGVLARKYLGRRKRFSVVAQVDDGSSLPSDLSAALGFAVLDAVHGVRIDEAAPDVVFRAIQDRKYGAVGVQMRVGEGGIPTGGSKAWCLVSGGMHSSVVAWKALLMGYRLEMVHAKVDDESVRAVARLYAELSNRADPTALHLTVLKGGDRLGSLARNSAKKRPVFGGFHLGGGEVPSLLERVERPLYLLTEEEFRGTFSALSFKDDARAGQWESGRGARAGRLAFGGKRADTSQVIDGLR